MKERRKLAKRRKLTRSGVGTNSEGSKSQYVESGEDEQPWSEGQARWDKAEGVRGLESQAREAEVKEMQRQAGETDTARRLLPGLPPACLLLLPTDFIYLT